MGMNSSIVGSPALKNYSASYLDDHPTEVVNKQADSKSPILLLIVDRICVF